MPRPERPSVKRPPIKGPRKPQSAAGAPEPSKPFTYRLTLEYEGTRYSGWQEQQNARTVTGELRRAAAAAGATVLEIGGAGRTDAGVHALGQSAHLRLGEPHDPERLRWAINDALPYDVHVLRLEPAAPRFHARHDAVERSYLYQLLRRRSAFAKRHAWWIKDRLDLDRLRRAAELLVGRHDFRLFCVEPGKQTSTVVEVGGVEIVEAEGLVLVRMVASHFLWRMVRRAVGTLVEVATGRLELAELAQLVEGKALAPGRGTPAEWTAPPAGLFLEKVRYPGDPPLAPPRSVLWVP